jgi:hypothetical protein
MPILTPPPTRRSRRSRRPTSVSLLVVGPLSARITSQAQIDQLVRTVPLVYVATGRPGAATSARSRATSRWSWPRLVRIPTRTTSVAVDHGPVSFSLQKNDRIIAE